MLGANPNGSGKTTLMRIICGLIKANEGAVIYNGEDTNEKSDSFRTILGFLPQDTIEWE
ncbi:ATP-binding cassette domain-containing protein [Terribacillus halophilus]|uniref:ATP-binding cassette domain-containing protein n=1 Tax=Terribacillus halophilus TaxID=361279 RepID=UPI001BB08C12